MNDYLDAALRKVVSSHEWSFLRRRVVLTLDSAADIEGWEYVYDAPSDVERVIRIEPTDLSARNYGEAIRYSMNYDYDITGADVKLVCDIADAEMLYILAVSTLNTAPGSTAPYYFVEAVAAELASMTAMPLLVDPGIAARSMALAKELLEVAIASELTTQMQSDDWPESDFIAVRQ